VRDLRGEAVGEALEAQQICRRQLLLARGFGQSLPEQVFADVLGCLIIIVQSRPDLSSIVNAGMSGTHHSPSRGITR